MNQREIYALKEYDALHLLNANYLSRTCPEFTYMYNRYEHFDAIVLSGNCQNRVLIEFKDRNLSLLDLNDAFIEVKKFNSLKDIYLKNNSSVLFIQQFDANGYIFIWDITRYFQANTLRQGYEMCPSKSYVNNGFEKKSVYYLPFDIAGHILRTGTYDRISSDQFRSEIEAVKKLQLNFLNEFITNHNLEL